MAKGKAKGSSFERKICKQLSLWWSKGKADDIFWRTSGSGARAKTRSKKGESTFGQYGDVQATNPIGQPLIDLCTIEVKKGYRHHTIFDLIDKLPSETKQPYEKFICQAMRDSELAKTFSWLLIAKRDRKETLIFFNPRLYDELRESGSRIKKAVPFILLRLQLDEIGKFFIYGTTFTQFFKLVKPVHVKDVVKRWER